MERDFKNYKELLWSVIEPIRIEDEQASYKMKVNLEFDFVPVFCSCEWKF